jgi:AAA+ ATPase superfamily predicted ATPase
MEIVGRREEQRQLKEYYKARMPHFLVVYGRRRVGKTFLVRETFRGKFCFYFTAYANLEKSRQLFRFNVSLREHGEKDYPVAADWFEAFDQLRDVIEHSRIKEKKVVFLDEMPWMDTRKSGFLTALEGFWNGWASGREDILLIVCGSATSWITKKLFRNRGGLHNRVTRRMYVEPFSLRECDDFFRSKGISYNKTQILDIYMIFGGIPYYLDLIDGTLSVPGNIDVLCFRENGVLTDEYQALYGSLFNHPERYTHIVETLAKKAKGLTRYEIVKAANVTDGGGLTTILSELEQCGFIRKYNEYRKKNKDAVFQLIDPFTLFFLKHMQGEAADENHWSGNLQSGSRNAWKGYAFEMVCLWHIAQIKRKLGIAGVSTSVYTWRSKHSEPQAQIDLVIDRRDGVTNLCEIKYVNEAFVISEKYSNVLRIRSAAFQEETHTPNALHTTFISAYGLSDRGYRADVISEISLDDLFES